MFNIGVQDIYTFDSSANLRYACGSMIEDFRVDAREFKSVLRQVKFVRQNDDQREFNCVFWVYCNLQSNEEIRLALFEDKFHQSHDSDLLREPIFLKHVILYVANKCGIQN